MIGIIIPVYHPPPFHSLLLDSVAIYLSPILPSILPSYTTSIICPLSFSSVLENSSVTPTNRTFLHLLTFLKLLQNISPCVLLI